MKRKILAISALVLVAVSVGAVSAFDLGGLFDDSSNSQPQNVTIEGIDFNIPAGFSEDPEYAENGTLNETAGLKYTTWVKAYSNDKDEAIAICVGTYDGVKVDDEMPSIIGDGKLTVNGVKGYKYDVEPYKGFTYAKDGKLVIITTTNETFFKDVVVK